MSKRDDNEYSRATLTREVSGNAGMEFIAKSLAEAPETVVPFTEIMRILNGIEDGVTRSGITMMVVAAIDDGGEIFSAVMREIKIEQMHEATGHSVGYVWVHPDKCRAEGIPEGGCVLVSPDEITGPLADEVRAIIERLESFYVSATKAAMAEGRVPGGGAS